MMRLRTAPRVVLLLVVFPSGKRVRHTLETSPQAASMPSYLLRRNALINKAPVEDSRLRTR